MFTDWLIGQAARVDCAITDIDGSPIDPAMLRLKVKAPGGTVTTYSLGGAEIVKTATGTYHADVALPTSGVWSWRWESDAPSTGAAEGSIVVRKSRVI